MRVKRGLFTTPKFSTKKKTQSKWIEKNSAVRCVANGNKKREKRERHFSNWDETRERLHHGYVAVFQSCPDIIPSISIDFLSAFTMGIIRMSNPFSFAHFVHCVVCVHRDKQRNCDRQKPKRNRIKAEWIELRGLVMIEAEMYLKQINIVCG